MLHIFSDGSCLFNGLPNAVASWSYMVTDEEGIVKEGCTGTVDGIQDNNRAELTAFVKALRYVRNERFENFMIHVDYEAIYLYANGKVNPKANLDLYREINYLLKCCGDRVKVTKVKAHSPDTLVGMINHTVDRTARKACKLFGEGLRMLV